MRRSGRGGTSLGCRGWRVLRRGRRSVRFGRCAGGGLLGAVFAPWCGTARRVSCLCLRYSVERETKVTVLILDLTVETETAMDGELEIYIYTL